MKHWAIGILTLVLSSCQSQPVSQPEIFRQVPGSLAPYVAVSENAIVLENATVLTGDGSSPLRDQSVFIVGDTIKAVRPQGTIGGLENVRRIDLSGGTVMPGFVGMHNHLHMPGITLMDYTAPRLYLAGGVTTIQTAGAAEPEGEAALKHRIDKGEVPGPNIVLTAPYITGPEGNAVMFKPETEDAARQFVRDWASRGAKWVKLYRHTDPDMAKAIIEEAHKHGLKVTGHLCSITYAEASGMGIDSIEHGLNAASDFVTNKPKGKCVPSKASRLTLDVNDPEVGGLIDTLVDQNVTLTSTLAILESGYPHRPQGDNRALKALSTDNLQAYNARQIRLKDSEKTTTSTPEYWHLITQFERRFVSEGGRLVAGPDNGRHVLPGYGDQRNFELLIESGFSVPEVVQIMTYNGAEALGIGDDIGLVKSGFRADLILLSDDLTENPSAIKNPLYVFKGGTGYDPAKLIADTDGQVGLR